MMKLEIWPRKTGGSILRVSVLLAALLLLILGSIEIRRVGKTGETFLRTTLTIVGGRFFRGFAGETPSKQPIQAELDATYGLSLVRQLSIVEKSRKFAEQYGAARLNVANLAKYGIGPNDMSDPWGRPYRVWVLDGHLIVVQSTGPSGRDAMSAGHPGAAASLLAREVQLVGDNLVVAQDLDAGEVGRVR